MPCVSTGLHLLVGAGSPVSSRTRAARQLAHTPGCHLLGPAQRQPACVACRTAASGARGGRHGRSGRAACAAALVSPCGPTALTTIRVRAARGHSEGGAPGGCQRLGADRHQALQVSAEADVRRQCSGQVSLCFSMQLHAALVLCAGGREGQPCPRRLRCLTRMSCNLRRCCTCSSIAATASLLLCTSSVLCVTTLSLELWLDSMCLRRWHALRFRQLHGSCSCSKVPLLLSGWMSTLGWGDVQAYTLAQESSWRQQS